MKLNDSDTTLKELIAALWHYRFLIFCSLVLSFFCALTYVKNVPHLYKVEVLVEFHNDNTPGVNLPSALDNVSQAMPFFFNGDVTGNNQNFIPKFLGNRFLRSLTTESVEKDNLEKYCGYNPSPPKIFSISGLLVLTGVSNFKMPTDEQKIEKKIVCARSILTIEKYKYKTIKTEAYKIFILHEDPVFAANFLNDAVQKYFENEKTESKKQKREQISYMYETLRKIDLEKNEAKLKLSKTVLENPSIAFIVDSVKSNMMGTRLNSSQSLNVAKELGNLKAQREVLVEKKELLLGFRTKGSNDPRLFIDLIKNDSSFSNKFLSKMREIDSSKFNYLDLRNLEPEMSTEISLLSDLILTLDKKIAAKTGELKKQDAEVKEYEKARLDYNAKNFAYEKLKSSIENEGFKLGLDLLNENDIHTFAVPPLRRVSPDSVLALATFSLFFIFLSMLYIFIRHFINGYVYYIDQIKTILDDEKISSLSLSKQLSPKTLLVSGIQPTGSYNNFKELFLEKGKIGLFIEVGKSRSKNLWISESVATFFAKLYSKTNRSVLVDSIIENSSLLKSASKYSLDRNLALDQGKRIEKGQVSFHQGKLGSNPYSHDNQNISGIYKSFDQALIACNELNDFDEIAELTDLSDFFVIVIRYGHIRKSRLQTFLFSLQKYENKFNGIILVN